MDIKRISGQNRRPQGESTRGKTAPNRLRRADHFLIHYDPGVITRGDGVYRKALFVDVGFGKNPGTTLESAARFRRIHPGLPVLGVEIDPERVKEALPFAGSHTHFRPGGFNLPLDKKTEPVRLIRAFNVLRQYKEEAVADAFKLMASYLLPGGVILEGTSDPTGRLWVANLLRRKGDRVIWEALIFSVNLKGIFDPALLQPVLPKNLIHRMVPGEKIFNFFEKWKKAHKKIISRGIIGSSQLFSAACRELSDSRYNLYLQRRWLSRGYLIWKIDESYSGI